MSVLNRPEFFSKLCQSLLAHKHRHQAVASYRFLHDGKDHEVRVRRSYISKSTNGLWLVSTLWVPGKFRITVEYVSYAISTEDVPETLMTAARIMKPTTDDEVEAILILLSFI